MLPGLVSLPRQAVDTSTALRTNTFKRRGQATEEVRQVVGWGTKVTGDISNHLLSRNPSRSGGAQRGGKGLGFQELLLERVG